MKNANEKDVKLEIDSGQEVELVLIAKAIVAAMMCLHEDPDLFKITEATRDKALVMMKGISGEQATSLKVASEFLQMTVSKIVVQCAKKEKQNAKPE